VVIEITLGFAVEVFNLSVESFTLGDGGEIGTILHGHSRTELSSIRAARASDQVIIDAGKFPPFWRSRSHTRSRYERR